MQIAMGFVIRIIRFQSVTSFRPYVANNQGNCDDSNEFCLSEQPEIWMALTMTVMDWWMIEDPDDCWP